MNTGWFNLPWWVWGVLCLAVALIYTFVWPQSKVMPDVVAWRYFILRWGHALVWVILATSFFVRGAIGGAANLVALAGLVVYGVFMALFVSS